MGKRLTIILQSFDKRFYIFFANTWAKDLQSFDIFFAGAWAKDLQSFCNHLTIF